MLKTAKEIIERLEGTNAAARFFEVRPPSVSGWLRQGRIPDERLVIYAAELEHKTAGWFSRRQQWPERYAAIWPELALKVPSAHPTSGA